MTSDVALLPLFCGENAAATRLTSRCFHGLTNKPLCLVDVCLGGFHQPFLPPVAHFARESDDVEVVVLTQVVQYGFHGVLGLLQLVTKHGSAGIQYKEDILWNGRESGQCKVVDEISISDL